MCGLLKSRESKSILKGEFKERNSKKNFRSIYHLITKQSVKTQQTIKIYTDSNFFSLFYNYIHKFN